MTDKILGYSIKIKGEKIDGLQNISILHDDLGHIADKEIIGTIEDAWNWACGFCDGLIHSEEKLLKGMIDCTTEIIESNKAQSNQEIINEIHKTGRLLARFIKHGDLLGNGELNPLSPHFSISGGN